MIKKLKIHISDGFDPYINLAVEKYLFDAVERDTCTLYLWQNGNTVVIGKNQNALAECRTELLESEGGKLARRLSGGGAVFHDLGNLNFTFICHTDNFDVTRQLSVISRACMLAGIKTEVSGRNDLLADGKKFSGNAFYNSGGRSYHHGTILISADTDKMQRYLSPPKAKLEAKGVKSVRSRVVNLCELAPDLTVEKMKKYMLSAFESVYGLSAEPHEPHDAKTVSDLAEKYASREYLFGTPIPFTVSVGGRLTLGNVELQLAVKSGAVESARLYTDSLDTTLPDTVESALVGVNFQTDEIRSSLLRVLPETVAGELVSLIENQIF